MKKYLTTLEEVVEVSPTNLEDSEEAITNSPIISSETFFDKKKNKQGNPSKLSLTSPIKPSLTIFEKLAMKAKRKHAYRRSITDPTSSGHRASVVRSKLKQVKSKGDFEIYVNKKLDGDSFFKEIEESALQGNPPKFDLVKEETESEYEVSPVETVKPNITLVSHINTGTATIAKIEDEFWREERKNPIIDKIFEKSEKEISRKDKRDSSMVAQQGSFVSFKDNLKPLWKKKKRKKSILKNRIANFEPKDRVHERWKEVKFNKKVMVKDITGRIKDKNCE